MHGAFAATAQALAGAMPVTVTALAGGLLRIGNVVIREQRPVPAGFPPWPVVMDRHDRRRLELVACEVGQRLCAAVGRAALRAETERGERVRVTLADVGSRTRDRVPMGFGR